MKRRIYDYLDVNGFEKNKKGYYLLSDAIIRAIENPKSNMRDILQNSELGYSATYNSCNYSLKNSKKQGMKLSAFIHEAADNLSEH